MKYDAGLVSVIIPTYKRADKLMRAVNSVCSQTYKNIEVLVVNDNENDDQYTLALQQMFASVTDPRVRLVFQPKHINGAAARNAGIRQARGEYIAFLDAVDMRTHDLWNDLHSLFGAVCALAELQIALPGELRSEYPLRQVLDRRPFI